MESLTGYGIGIMKLISWKKIPRHKLTFFFIIVVLTDVDECNMNTDSCTDLQLCINTPGSFKCECKQGYRMENEICKGKILINYSESLIA